ncbi:KRAB domain-containing zinc finger protein [Clonorchis sinensis]|uniref:KRAB domain-containing zinc finger protein n=1 Tax=Clonorchis sinensis TaxID=79923 RepID=G7YV95_CLOSI|nr:KRAB domain-containing zinc finger protein [Clonorchis sinensis]
MFSGCEVFTLVTICFHNMVFAQGHRGAPKILLTEIRRGVEKTTQPSSSGKLLYPTMSVTLTGATNSLGSEVRRNGITNNSKQARNAKSYQYPEILGRFPNPSPIEKHRESSSAGHGYWCTLYPRAYMHSSTFCRHIERIHPGEGSCPTRISTPRVSHMMTTRHKCDECRNESPSYPCLFAHKTDAHTNRRRPVCWKCGLDFMDNSGLKKHIKFKHTKVEPYKCDACNRTFTYLNNFRRHMNTVHNRKHTDASVGVVCGCKNCLAADDVQPYVEVCNSPINMAPDISRRIHTETQDRQ